MEDLRETLIRKLTRAVEAGKVEWKTHQIGCPAGCICGDFHFSLLTQGLFGPHTLQIRNVHGYRKGVIEANLDTSDLQACLQDLFNTVRKVADSPTCTQILAAIPEV